MPEVRAWGIDMTGPSLLPAAQAENSSRRPKSRVEAEARALFDQTASYPAAPK